MNITLDAASASVLTALVVGLISLFSTMIANTHSLRQRDSQWAREDRRDEKAEQQREKERDASNKKAVAGELRDIYANALSSLAMLLGFNTMTQRMSAEYKDSLAEAEKRVAVVLAIYHDRQHPKYVELMKLFRDNSAGIRSLENVMQLRDAMIDLVSADSRIGGL